jgi:pimeloyl-ACP methyl ester carboxylesterase
MPRRTPGRLLAPLVVSALVLAACSGDDGPTANSSRPSGSDSATTTEASTSSTEVVGTDDTTSTTTPPPAEASIEWAPCDDPEVTDPSLDCATVQVPIDYDDPASDTIGIALVRVPASGDRQGAVLFNPGGPGGSGFDWIATGGTTVVAQLGLEDFDLIGFDPRGVDRSNGIRCLTDAQQDQYAFPDTTPDTPEEEAFLDEIDAAFDTACIAAYGDTMIEYSTENTARDMDTIRAGLGDDQLSFIGISYGTYLGATYATLFPDRVRAMVLDSAFDPGGDSIEEQYTTQIVGFETAFTTWADWCDGEPTCAFRVDGSTTAEAWDALRVQLDETPIPNADGRIGNQAVMELATISALYSDTQWPALAAGLADAAAGDPAGLFQLADTYNGRDETGAWTTISQSGSIISCASGINQDLPPDPQALVDELLRVAPRFAAGVRAEDFTDECASLMPKVTAPELSYAGDAPIVVIGGTNDPATPFRWAEELTEKMGPNAALVTYTGEGHGHILAASCLDTVYNDVLVGLTTPAPDTTCDPDPDYPKPEWWDTVPVPDGVSEVQPLAEILGALGLAASDGYAEVRTSTLPATEVLDLYAAALSATGNDELSREEPLPGVLQGVYLFGDEVLSVIAIGPGDLANPELGLSGLIPDGETMVILLALKP